MQVNGEKVRTYMHADLVTVLKRCQKGNQATFTLLRQPQEVRVKPFTLGGGVNSLYTRGSMEGVND